MRDHVSVKQWIRKAVEKGAAKETIAEAVEGFVREYKEASAKTVRQWRRMVEKGK